MTALKRSLSVRRDARKHGHIRPRERLGHEVGSLVREPPPATLLPGQDEPPRRLVVEDRRPRRREGDPPPTALRASPHRPGTRGAATGAERRREADQRRTAVPAQRG